MIPDPRPPHDARDAPPAARELYALAQRSLDADTGQESAVCDAKIVTMLSDRLAHGDSASISTLFARAPSLDVHRHLWRLLALRAARALDADAELAATLFAIPLIVVTGMAGGPDAQAMLPAVLRDASAIASLLVEHAALAGNRSFALSAGLVSADAIDLPRLPVLMQAARAFAGGEGAPLDLPPSPMHVHAGEAAHLRFVVGSALASPHANILAANDTGRWGLPLSRAVSVALSAPGVTVLALPRAASSLPAAVMLGRAAQREVAAQLFASNALRQLRASVGEPVAVVSAHRAADAPGGGELRLSLSSPLSPRDAHGFRCTLLAGERVADVVAMLARLLEECRVADVRLVDGVHADRDPVTGGRLMFKPDTLPPGSVLH